MVSRVLIAVLAALILIGYGGVLAQAGDPTCAGVYEPLPVSIDPATPADQLPCYNGFPAPYGHPGAIPFYTVEGRLHWIDSDGDLLTTSADPLDILSSDSSRVLVWATWSGRSLGEKILILKDNCRAKGRALSNSEATNG